jgi:hypothetical protein
MQPNIIVENIISNLKQPSDFHFYTFTIECEGYSKNITFSFKQLPSTSELHRRLGEYLKKHITDIFQNEEDLEYMFNEFKSSMSRKIGIVPKSIYHTLRSIDDYNNMDYYEVSEKFYSKLTSEMFYSYITNLGIFIDYNFRVDKLTLDVE